MRVIFAGTPPFAASALRGIVAAGHQVVLVLTQPDRPSGRGLKRAPGAVAQEAAAHALPLAQPASLKDPSIWAQLKAQAADVMVVAAYGMLLPPEVLAIPGRGCINIHASLLPRWRGAAPIQRAILAGDPRTGISIMQMEAGLDTGPVLLAREYPIGERDTTGTLTASLAHLGTQSIVEALSRLESLDPVAQDEALATYAPKVRKTEARVDWSRPAAEIERQVRAFDPSPGAEARLGELLVKVWESRTTGRSGPPGRVLEANGDDLIVACGTGALRIESLQRPGGRRMTSREFLRGQSLDTSENAS